MFTTINAINSIIKREEICKDLLTDKHFEQIRQLNRKLSRYTRAGIMANKRCIYEPKTRLYAN